MQSVQKLKEEVLVNTEMTGLLDVLKGIAVSEFRELETQKERFEKFLEAFEGFFHFIDFSLTEHPFSKSRGNLGIIMITSDEGFMGGLNARVINAALDIPGADKAELIIIGERGAGQLKSLGRTFVGFPGITSQERFDAALKLKDFIIKETLAGQFGRLILFYPRPISFTVQHIEMVTILPCTELFEKREDVEEKKKDIIVESSLESMIEYLVEAWITQKLFEVFEDSKLSEFAARSVHLEESYQASVEQGKGIRNQYFRTRRESIDKSMRDMFSSLIMRRKESS